MQIFRRDAGRVCRNAASLRAAVCLIRHQRAQHGRIQTAGQKRAQRHIRDHLHFDDAIKRFQNSFLPPRLRFVRFNLVKRNIPP